MPIIDGKVVRATFTSLKLNELSSVDRPAQAGARAVIMKRDDRSGDKPEVNKGENVMPTIEELQAEVGKLKAQVTSLTGERDAATAKAADAVAKADKAKADMDEMMTERDEAKKALTAATDEVIKVDTTEVRKSEVGAAQFAVTKALIERAETAEFEKRAQDEFPHIVGTAAEKALVLKAMATMPEATSKALTAILTSAEKMISAGFSRIGTSFAGERTVEKAQAEAGFTAKVQEVAKRDAIPLSQAMGKARTEFPAEFAKAYPDAN